MKISKVYKRGKKLFRYDYDNALVLWVFKATKNEINDNKEWQEKYGKNLWDIDDDGYIEISSVGLGKVNWTNKDARDGYLDLWIDELEEESRWLAKEFEMYG